MISHSSSSHYQSSHSSCQQCWLPSYPPHYHLPPPPPAAGYYRHSLTSATSPTTSPLPRQQQGAHPSPSLLRASPSHHQLPGPVSLPHHQPHHCLHQLHHCHHHH